MTLKICGASRSKTATAWPMRWACFRKFLRLPREQRRVQRHDHLLTSRFSSSCRCGRFWRIKLLLWRTPLRSTKRFIVLGVLIASVSGTLATKRNRLDRLHQLEDWLIHEMNEEILAEELLSILFQLEIFDLIPGVGAISGAVLNLVFMRKVDETARRVFQERWLRDAGKVQSIPAAPVHERELAVGWAGALRRVGYAGCYCAGFGVALPAYILLTRLAGPLDR